jgi:hypothetical protein
VATVIGNCQLCCAEVPLGQLKQQTNILNRNEMLEKGIKIYTSVDRVRNEYINRGVNIQ